MGFTPQFVDLDLDGNMDIITGQYNGHVTWYRGFDLDKYEGGFDAGQLLDQEGDPDDVEISASNYNCDPDDVKSTFYWLYSPANFGDFDDDGLLDMIVGGKSLRISKNIGTKAKPRFAKRELLLDINDKPLIIYKLTKEEKEFYRKNAISGIPAAGVGGISPIVVDWDNDGVLDLMATNHYNKNGLPAITYFRGVKTAKGHRFEEGVSLLKGKDDAKVFPGRDLHICIADWNNDGVNDLIIGTAIVTLHDDEFSGYLSWNWENETGLRYDMRHYDKDDPTAKRLLKEYLERETVKEKIPAEDFLTVRHRGRVYVMLGEKK